MEDMFHSAKVKAWEWSRSLWMMWTFVPYLNFIAFLYVGIRTKKNAWMLWGVFYALPLLMFVGYVIPGFQDGFWSGLVKLLVNLAVAAVFSVIGIVHAVALRREYLVRRSVMEEADARTAHDLRNELEIEYDVSTRDYVPRRKGQKPPKTVRSQLSWNTTSQRVVAKESDDWN